MRLPTMMCSAVRVVRSYFRREWDLETLLDMINDDDHRLTLQICYHLSEMYRIVVWISGSFIIGIHLRLAGDIGGLFAGVGSLVCAIWFPKISPLRQAKRLSVLITGAMFGGVLVGPWFSSIIDGDSDFIVKAILAITFVGLDWLEAAQFYLFSFSNLLLSNPLEVEALFVCGLILTANPAIVYRFEIYTCTLWFVAYAGVYSRTLVRRIRLGDTDYVNHAVTFFTDAPAVCLRMINLVLWGAWREIKERLEDSVANYVARIARGY